MSDAGEQQEQHQPGQEINWGGTLAARVELSCPHARPPSPHPLLHLALFEPAEVHPVHPVVKQEQVEACQGRQGQRRLGKAGHRCLGGFQGPALRRGSTVVSQEAESGRQGLAGPAPQHHTGSTGGPT